MKTSLHRFLSLTCAIAAALAAAPLTHAIEIEGLTPFEPVTAGKVTPAVADETLQLRLADGRMLTVAPWPAFLPQRFGKQSLSGNRHMHPAGPADRLALTRSEETQPWLVLANGARRSTGVVENWQLRLSGKRWLVANGRARKVLGNAERNASPVMINAEADRWCLYLLDSDTPAGKPNLATEAEPQIAWAAIRLHRLQTKCPAKK
jgi:hypothetical protein